LHETNFPIEVEIKEVIMKSTAAWEREEMDLVNGAPPVGNEELVAVSGYDEPEGAGANITSLRELTFKLLRKVESIGEAQAPNIQSGIDFYEEVSRFEIDLIKRALVQTGGHQRRAARLLNLKVTTLNSKIKHYNINIAGNVYGYSLVEPGDVEGRRSA
jgi:DNA-binding NtrC family response regulator